MWQTIGHGWAVQALQRALTTGRLPHALLLTGPAQVGKAHLAREFAAALNCQSAGLASSQPCGHCRACTLTAQGLHPDLALVAPEGEHARTARIKIDQVRGLQRALALTPVEGRWRIAILSDFEMATEEAANALLKTLEEPPAHAILLLTSVDAGLLLPTIVSRCQVLALRMVAQAEIARALQERLGLPAERADALARLAGGRVGWALRAAQEPALVEARAQSLDGLAELLRSGRAARLNMAERYARQEDLLERLRLWQGWWRDVTLTCAGCEELVAHVDRLPELRRAAQAHTLATAQAALRGIESSLAQLQQNVNPRLALEVLFLSWQRLSAAPGTA